MHAVMRAPLLAALGLLPLTSIRAQSPERPPIFAPRPASTDAATVPRVSASPLSDHVRLMINAAATRALEAVPVSDAPVATGGALVVDATTGAMVMAPVVVKGLTLRESQVRPPSLRLFHFEPLPGDKHRRVAGGVTAPLYHTFIGNKEFQADFNIVNLAGRGVDHQTDFTRVELAFTLKW